MSASKPDNRPETFLKLVLQNPINRILVDRLPKLGLHDVWLVAGCLFQTVWNIKVGRPPAEGIRDYDIFYFNEDDLSWEAENEDIHRVAEQLRDLAISVELKNQARVHLWYSERFGPGYPQLRQARTLCTHNVRASFACKLGDPSESTGLPATLLQVFAIPNYLFR